MYFAIYETAQILPTRERTRVEYIVLKEENGLILRFTGLEVFCCTYTGDLSNLSRDSRFGAKYACMAINWIFQRFQLTRIVDITDRHIYAFLDYYRGSPKVIGGETYRSQESVDKCGRVVSHFFANLALAIPASKIEVDNLVKKSWKRTRGRNGESLRLEEVYVQRYHYKAKDGPREILIRDIPEAVILLILQQAEIYDEMIYGAIEIQLLTGLRPAELMNLRQPGDSLTRTPCIQFERAGDKITAIKLDINRELALRSDGIDVGGIKKHRTVSVWPGFFQRFVEIYELHMALLARHKNLEQESRPMFLNKRGRAMTYDTYRERFQSLIRKRVVPILLRSEDPELQAVGLAMQSRPPAPHALRHYFTCCLVLEGLTAEQIKFYRGDENAESAVVYLENKGEIVKLAAKLHARVVDGLRR